MNAWFSTRLPALVVARFDDFLTLEGTIGFDVAGDRWTLVLGDPESPVRHEKASDANLSLKFTARAFEQFTEGALDVAAAVRSGQVTATGRFELLDGLAMLMTPVQRDLGWDAG